MTDQMQKLVYPLMEWTNMKLRTLLVVLPLSLLFIACSGTAVPATTTPAAKQEPKAAPAGWEQRWNAVVAEARKEGSVAVYSLWRPETRTTVTTAFKDKFGINVEFTPFGRGAELVAKVQAEQRAGLFYVDTFGAGNPLLQTSMKPEGLLGPLRPLLILPEVTDPRAWRAGAVPFSDDEGTAVSLISVTIRTIAYNVDLIREGELTSYEDLLKPQYKGKITLNDPTVTGPGNAAISHLGHSLWGEEKTVDFLRRLLRDQGAVVQRDNRVHMESVARGKYAIAVAPLPDLVAEFYELKAPVKAALVKEDNRLTAAAGALGVPTRFAHPNAATVLVNWLLTREGQSVFSRSWGNPATRADVPTEGINPLFVPVPGEKYFVESADAMNARARWLQLAKKVIDETSR
ncbi:MAG: ABC transporter substrate-binding protein [Chloroflexi bacterium]|nr:ABC transporter substrate-binding protein [Chloroflexota bacterium]